MNIGLKFLKIPILLILLGTFLPSSGFSKEIEDEAIKHELSARLGGFIDQEVKKLEDVVVKLRTENLALLKIIKEDHSFFDFIFAANRNSRDFKLIQAEYRFKKKEISLDELTAVQQEVSFPIVLPSLPTDLDPVLNGGISPGVHARLTSASVTALAKQSDAILSPDRDRSTTHRRMSVGTVTPSTIRSRSADITDLSSMLGKFFFEEEEEEDGKVVLTKLLKEEIL